MNYHGDDITPVASRNNGYWVYSEDIFDVSKNTHIQFMIDNPELFGLSLNEIALVYNKYNEKLGIEARAREDLIKVAAKRGWIRIRHYTRPNEYWSIQCDSIKDREQTIKNFLN
jgi:hypothetical protein